MPIAFLISFFTLARGQHFSASLATLLVALVVGSAYAYLSWEEPLQELSRVEVYWRNSDPWWVHADWLWACVGVYSAALIVAQSERWRRKLAAVSAQRDRQAERQRIAGDLHDVIGHAVTVMILQAAVAESAMDTDPARAKGSLVHIRRQGNSAIAELHRTLRVLETEDPGEREVRLSSVGALVESARAGGREVTLAEHGSRAAVPAGVEVSAYRIIQEALTNASKHGDPAQRIDIELDWRTAGTLRIAITNRCESPGRTSPSLGSGRGLIGMHERARVAGGTLHASSSDGYHRVIATLPTADTTPTL